MGYELKVERELPLLQSLGNDCFADSSAYMAERYMVERYMAERYERE